MDLITVVSAIVALQLYVRQRHPSHPLAGSRIIVGQVLFIVTIFYFWSSSQGAATQTVDQVYSSIQQALIGSEDGEFAQTAKSRGDSASQIGVPLYELFVRIFLVSVVYCIASAATAVFSLRDRAMLGDSDVTNGVLTLLFGGVALTCVSALHAFGGVTSYLYRHAGFGMMLATMLGSLGLTYLGRRAVRAFRARSLTRTETVTQALSVTFALLLLGMSIVTVHPSPYLLNPGQHVPESELDGYETTFEQRPVTQWDADTAVWYGSIRVGPGRYFDALGIDPPFEKRAIWSGAVPNESLGSLPEFYRSKNDTVTRRDHYLPIAAYERERETGPYRGIRYTEAGFDEVPDQPGVHRVMSNGDVTVYYVDVDLYNESFSGPTADDAAD